MGTGKYPTAYLDNPTVKKTADKIYADLNAYTREILPGEEDHYDEAEFTVVLPPLDYAGRFLKGIFYSNAVDLILERLPQLKEAFHAIATSNWVSYPWSEKADAYFTAYPNESREAWFTKKNPKLADKILIPRDVADDVSEVLFRPTPNTPRDISLLCVARPETSKNLPVICEALKVYRKKYPENRLLMYWYNGHVMDLNYTTLSAPEIEVMREIETVLIHPTEYLRYLNRPIDYENDLPTLYSHARAIIIGDLIGRKNRTMMEAMACNTPVILPKAHNQYVRGDAELLPEGAGVTPDFTPEAMADAIHHVLQHQQDFRPRQCFMASTGRRSLLNTCIDSFPYYREHLPDYDPGCHHESYWLDLAMEENYRSSLHAFYSHTAESRMPFRVKGLDNIVAAVGMVFSQYCPEPALTSPR